MLQLEILSGRRSGQCISATSFPFRIGRSDQSDLALPEEGVWDQHVEITLKPNDGFYARALSSASVVVNDNPISSARLANGDILTLGSIQARLGFSPLRQKKMRTREILTWIALAGVVVAQFALIYWLLA